MNTELELAKKYLTNNSHRLTLMSDNELLALIGMYKPYRSPTPDEKRWHEISSVCWCMLLGLSTESKFSFASVLNKSAREPLDTIIKVTFDGKVPTFYTQQDKMYYAGEAAMLALDNESYFELVHNDDTLLFIVKLARQYPEIEKNMDNYKYLGSSGRVMKFDRITPIRNASPTGAYEYLKAKRE